MTTDIWLIILSVVGLLITAYLAISHLAGKKVVCPINSRSCNAVLDSKWSSIFGIKNEIIGLIYYAAIIIGVILINKGYPVVLTTIKVVSALSALFSTFLMLVQVRILREFCFYCFCTTIVNIAIFILLVR